MKRLIQTLAFAVILLPSLAIAAESGYYSGPDAKDVENMAHKDTQLSASQQRKLEQVMSPKWQKNMREIDYSDSVEMTLAYFMCSPQGFPKGHCRKVKEVCDERYKMWKKAVRRGWKKPWVCTDPRVISKFIN